jgi:Flp pilus assembly protein TadG
VRDRRRGWGRSNRWAADRGAVTVEFAILAPVVFFLLMAIVQFGLWAHATHIAQLAATEAAGVTRFYGGSTSAGEQAARAELDRHLGTLNAVTVTVTLTGAEATVTVEGAAVGVLPGLALPVGASATAPREVPDQP